MKSIYCFAICVLMGSVSVGSVYAEEPADTVGRDLEEIVVKGSTQRTVKFGVEYTPDKKVKKSAVDATQLLYFMHIPQLNVSPVSGSIKTLSGDNVSMFIDYVPATSEDLAGMRPEDVKRVEVLRFPDDPRFNGAANVVNYIMQKYEWGGYTKLSLTGGTLGSDNISGNVFSKFAYKKWTYDVSAGGNGSRNENGDSHGVEIYRDIDFDGRHFDELRRESNSGINYLSKSNSQWATMRATYVTEKSMIRHTLSFNRLATPFMRNFSDIRYTGDVIPYYSASSEESTQTISPTVNGLYRFSLPKGNSIVAYWSYTHSGMRRNSTYIPGDFSKIINNNKERLYYPLAEMVYTKAFSHNNSLRTSFSTINFYYITDYFGSYTDTQKLLSSENILLLEYMQNWNCGLNLFTRIGGSYVLGRVNGVNTLEQFNPRIGAQLQYRINSKNHLTVEGWWGNPHPQPSSANTAVVQSNELLWLKGNPDLKNTLYIMTQAYYYYIPTNNFSLAVGLQYEGDPKKQAYRFFTLPGYSGLVRQIINSGDYHQYSAWVSGTLRLLDNSLSISLSGSAKRAVLTGCDARTANIFSGNINASYFLGKFAFSLYYYTPDKSISAWTLGALSSYKSQYGLTVNFNHRDFRASLSFSNWFNNKGGVTSAFTSPVYSYDTWSWSPDLSRKLSLTLTYTFHYGKKVNEGNEIGGAASQTSSAILK